MEMNGADEERQHPCLLILQKDKQYFYNVSTNQFHTTDIPELHNKNIIASAFGWLVLVDINTDDCCLWHPVSLDKIELPQLTWPQAFNKCILSKPPTEPDCHILLISSNAMVRRFCRIGDDQYVTQTSKENGEEMRLCAVVSFQGKIYGIVDSYRYLFVTVDFVGGTLELNPLVMEGGQPWDMPQPLRSWASGCVDYLIESSCGELLLVHNMFSCIHLQDGLDFRVFQVDIDRMKCNELTNIGERAIFCSNKGDAFCCASLGIKPNSIYYTVPDKSRNLFIYNLDDRSTTVFLPYPIAERSNSTSYWVPPKIFRNFLN